MNYGAWSCIPTMLLRSQRRMIQLVLGRRFTTNTQDFVIRRAKETDFHGVMDLSRTVFSEQYPLDWLCGRYLQYLNNPHVLASVILEEDEIIDYMNTITVDGGRACCPQGGRMTKKYQNTGLLSEAKVLHTKWFCKKLPNASSMRISSVFVDFWRANEKANKVNVLEKRTWIRMRLPDCHSHELREMQAPTEVSDIGVPGLSQIMGECFDTHQTFFPCGSLVAFNGVYGLRKDNAGVLAAINEPLFVGWTNDGNKRSLSLSSVTTADNDNAWRIEFNYYGRVDPDLVRSHLVTYIREVLELPARPRIYVILSLSDEFEGTFGTKGLASLFGRWFNMSPSDVSVMPYVACEYLSPPRNLADGPLRGRIVNMLN